MKNLISVTDDTAALFAGYSHAVQQVVKEAAVQSVTEAMGKIKGIGGYQNRRGAYRRGFAVKMGGSPLAPEAVLCNRQWRLTHLLERGHKTNLGRTLKKRVKILDRVQNSRKKTTTHAQQHGFAANGGTARAKVAQTRAFPHWDSAETVAVQRFEAVLKAGLEGMRLDG